MTGGKRESHAGGVWHAPKRDLISGLQAAMLEKREIEIPARYGPAFLLGKEPANLGSRVGSAGASRFGRLGAERDDLMMACALGCWRARWKARPMWVRGV